MSVGRHLFHARSPEIHMRRSRIARCPERAAPTVSSISLLNRMPIAAVDMTQVKAAELDDCAIHEREHGRAQEETRGSTIRALD